MAAKVQASLKHGLVPVICVGETAGDLEKFGASAVPVSQLEAALQGVSPKADIVVAYEPVWAIGSGQAATPQQAQDVCAALRAVVAKVLGDEAAARTRILYGCSVKAANIASFMREPDVDGALVGGASLVVTSSQRSSASRSTSECECSGAAAPLHRILDRYGGVPAPAKGSFSWQFSSSSCRSCWASPAFC